MSIKENCDYCTKEKCDDCLDRGFKANWKLNKDQMFKNVADNIVKTLTQKNYDYGDSFHNIYLKFGDLSTFIRLMDKIERMKTLITKSDIKVKDEPLEDVYLDIAGYCILTLVSRQLLQEEELCGL